MRKTILFLLMALLLPMLLSAQRTKTVSLDYNISDFNVTLDDEKNTIVTSDKFIVHFRKAQDAPALPCVGVNVLIGREDELSDFDISFSEVKLGSQVQMKQNPRAIHAGEKVETKIMKKPVFKKTVYPDTIVKYIGTCCRDGYRYLVFNVCPFAYEPKGGSLFLRHHIEMQIKLAPTAETVKYGPYVGTNMRDVVRRMVINPEELDILYPYRRKVPMMVASTVVPSIAGSEEYEYLIITNNALKDHFQRLADWKTMKGVRTKVITKEEIMSNYEVPSQYVTTNTNAMQVFKIKTAIDDYYQNHGTKYFLLGGRHSVVPTFRPSNYSFGCDWFYACLTGGSWNWNYHASMNDADISRIPEIVPDVYVTRVMLSLTSEASGFVDRIIDYESNSDPEDGEYHGLSWGSKIMNDFYVGSSWMSDSQRFSDWACQNMYPNVSNCKRLFDSYSNAGYPLSLDNLKYLLDDEYNEYDGYRFIHFSCPMHNDNKLVLGNDEYYTLNDARSMECSKYTLMTSATDCVENFYGGAFADAYMNNSSSNVIAFLGSTYTAYHSSDPYQILHTDLFIKTFYDYLFSRESVHYGQMATLAKCIFEPDEYDSFYYNDISIVIGATPLGDCEMPIYFPNCLSMSEDPQFGSGRITISYSNGILHVDTPDDSRICVMSKADKGATYYAVIDSVTQADFAPPLVECTLSITNPEYKPFVKTIFSPIYVQNENISGNREYVGNKVSIGYDVTTEKPLGPVKIVSGTTNVHARQVTIKNRLTVNPGAKFSINNN